MAPTEAPQPPLSSPAAVARAAPASARLRAEVWLHRHGWALPAAVLALLAAAAVLLTDVQPAQQRLDGLRAERRAVLTPAPAVPARPAVAAAPQADPEPGQAVRALLSRAEGNAAQVRRIAAIARAHGIGLPRAQYHTSRQAPSGIEHTDITLSFVSGYPQARSFIEAVLRDLPNASVDRIAIERDQALGSEAEVTLRLTLWRWPPAATREARP